MNKLYAIYLRKSREDMQAETRGEGDTLKKHERRLVEFAKNQGYPIGKIYKEVVSGDSIQGRPQMRQLLADVEKRKWDGVIVTELTRLSRGNSRDQGIVAETFKYSDTLIITPERVYNPSDEYDEEFVDWGLFMSRREYNMTRRRLLAGRTQSVKEGNYIGSIAPYGWEKIKINKSPSLVPHPIEGPILRQIYDWYLNGLDGADVGCTKIANKLNDLGIKTQRGKAWTFSVIRDIIKNPVNAGYLRWGYKQSKKAVKDGEIKTSRQRNYDCELYKANFNGQITLEDYEKSVAKLSSRIKSPYHRSETLKNPFAGIMKCSKCGWSMQLKSGQLVCVKSGCQNVSCDLSLIELYLLDSLKTLEASIRFSSPPDEPRSFGEDPKATYLEKIKKELLETEQQRERQFDSYERGIYTDEEFLERRKTVDESISLLKEQIKKLEREVKKSKHLDLHSALPKLQSLTNSYKILSNEQKNSLLKELFNSITYTRDSGGRWHTDRDNFSLELYPRFHR